MHLSWLQLFTPIFTHRIPLKLLILTIYEIDTPGQLGPACPQDFGPLLCFSATTALAMFPALPHACKAQANAAINLNLPWVEGQASIGSGTFAVEEASLAPAPWSDLTEPTEALASQAAARRSPEHHPEIQWS